MNYKKKLKNLILCLLILCLCGCNNGSNQDSSSNIEDKKISYCSEVYSKNNIIGNTFYYFSKVGNIYLQAELYNFETKTIDDMKVYQLDLENGSYQELRMPASVKNDDIMNLFDVDGNNNLYYICCPADNARGNQEYDLVKVSSEGIETARIDLLKFIEDTTGDTPYDFCVDRKGRVAVLMYDYLYIVDEAFSSYEKIKLENRAYITVNEAGEFICLMNDADNENEFIVCDIDIEQNKLVQGNKVNIPGITFLKPGNGEYSFYVTADLGIYGYNAMSNTVSLLFDFLTNSVEDIMLEPTANGDFLGTSVDEDNEDNIILYKPEQSVNKKKELIFGTFGIDTELQSAILEFNQTHSDVCIKVKDYSDGQDALLNFNTDIAAGNIPDLFDLSQSSMLQYIQQGLFEDLSPYFEKDSDVSEKDFIPNIAEAMKINGKMYFYSPGFEIYSMAVKKSDVGDATGWDYNDLQRLLHEKGEDVKLTHWNTKQEMLDMLLYAGLSDYVDIESGKCEFESEQFRSLLKLCNQYGDMSSEDSYVEMETKCIQEGKILAQECRADMNSFRETLAVFNGDVSFVGYPTSDKRGNYICFAYPVAISSKSKYKKEAWDYLKYLMTKEYQYNELGQLYLPLRQDIFDLLMKSETCTEEFTDEFGNLHKPISGEVTIDDFAYQMKPLTDEQAKQYEQLVYSASHSLQLYFEIRDIVDEEVTMFFEGEKDIDQVVNIIQSRVTTYINEKR